MIEDGMGSDGAQSERPLGGKERLELQREAAAAGLYDPRTESDACGVAFVANIKGQRSHALVKQGLGVLERLAHRGAVGSDPLTGDGAGILLQIPHAFFAEELRNKGIHLPAAGDYAVGQVFLPTDPWTHPPRVRLIERIAESEGLRVLGWRNVPTQPAHVGPLAQETMPNVAQVFLGRGSFADDATFERRLYVARKRIENEGRAQEGGEPFYVCSLSRRTVIYKGLLLPSRLARFYPDLSDPRFESALALVHQRYSTNTFPTWERAHPYRLLAHNGEINTLRGNVARMDARERTWLDSPFGADLARVTPVLDHTGSDSSMFDNCVELLLQSGRTLPHAMMMMIPEAWENDTAMEAEKRAFYAYHGSLLEPWDGPACIAFTDGRVIGAVLDRNGLRPSRYAITHDDMIVLASEAGVIDLDPANVRKLDRLRPGRMLLVDLEAGRVVDDRELKQSLASAADYVAWDKRTLLREKDLPAARPERLPKELDGAALAQTQRAFGYTDEDVRLLLGQMAQTGKEPIGAMGNDSPPAVLSTKPQSLFAYFRQLFAQVTNPPVDPIRERLVMSLRTVLGRRSSLFKQVPNGGRLIEFGGPVLSPAELQALRDFQDPSVRVVTLPALFRVSDGERGLTEALEQLRARAEQEIRAGATMLVISDRAQNADWAPIPSLLALGAVRSRITAAGLFGQSSLILESGEPREVMHFCLIVGFGAGAVCPYLAFDTIRAAYPGDGPDEKAARERATDDFVHAVEEGILKVLSKMGISTIESYRGAGLFEALGLSEALVAEFFPGTVSRIGGVDLGDLAGEIGLRHRQAFAPTTDEARQLESGGIYKWRRDGEQHAYNPNTIGLLQHAARSGKYDIYKKFSALVNREARESTLRGLFDFEQRGSVPLAEVEPASSIVQRFRTGAMSFGSISKEAHETIATAMNRMGGRSNSGEGGEDTARYGDKDKRSQIKQIASGRFGVTSAYLLSATELQIKMAQGAKPGEGGQLPGHKVDAVIAKTRHATEGVGLISPPPHHDIYSIEDLAQLIYDLRNANDQALISVKLVSEAGVGTVAAGVAKANADIILVSGDSGGTGAAPLSSIKHAGVPWELGIAEAHHVLVMNDLRGRVRLEVDGQLKTGRDVVVAALLGAELFGFGTAALVSLGCILMRVCHLNTCPVGVATQDPVLRARFAGEPEHVMNFMAFVAEEVRELMAELGFRTFDEMVGRVDMLRVRSDIENPKARKLRLKGLLHSPNVPASTPRRFVGHEPISLEKVLDRELIARAAPALERGEPVEIDLAITNEQRTACTLLSSEITRRHGEPGLPEGTIRIRFTGTAGQSFGAFLAPGVDVTVSGAANDSLGKGMCGGTLVIATPPSADLRGDANVLAGNVALYGATGGSLFVSGIAGERFAVRNSGATAVVEGVGDHACEYMTGGTVVVLGPTGRNFGAGMSGGIAYVADPLGVFASRVNGELVDVEPLDDDDAQRVSDLVRVHYDRTRSPLAWRMLSEWADWRGKFVKVVPREYRAALLKARTSEVAAASTGGAGTGAVAAGGANAGRHLRVVDGGGRHG
jgi:glutamate synthase (NADPH/NADH) large chain